MRGSIKGGKGMPSMFGKIARGVLLAVLIAPLGACALADVASGPPPSLYVLTAPSPDTPAARIDAQLVVEEFSAPAALNTSRIVFQPSPNEIKYYAGARWADRAPAMIASLLVETLSDTGRFSAVVGPGNQARTDISLIGDIRAFGAFRDADAGLGDGATKVRVALFVSLVNARDRRVVASREFSAEAPAGSGIDGIVAACDTALDTVLTEIAGWTVEQSAQGFTLREARPAS